MTYLVSRLIILAGRHPIGQLILGVIFGFIGITIIVGTISETNHSHLALKLIVALVFLAITALFFAAGYVGLKRASRIKAAVNQRSQTQPEKIAN